MGIELPIVVYTHTDMEDIWPMFFGQFQKYMKGFKIYVAVNKQSDKIPSDYVQLIYDDTKQYTERWKEILPQISEDIIMFLHEDMVLFDKPDYDSLQKYYGYVRENLVESVKLIYAGNGFKESPIDNTLVINEFAKFSIQPTIVQKNIFMQIVENVKPMNIWDFEQSIVSAGRDFMVRLGTEKRRGLYHYDSIVFPYIATAINKGKWNYNEYQNELDTLFREYNINPFERGIV